MKKVSWCIEKFNHHFDDCSPCSNFRPYFTAEILGYPNSDILNLDEVLRELNARLSGSVRSIKKVIFNNPATIILWSDGTKTVVKVENGEKYDKERGFLICYLKGIVGNKTLLKELDKWVGD